MVDTHYDLLTYSYIAYLDNDYSKLEKLVNDIKMSKVKCIFANLYFKKEDEMKEDMHKNYYNPNIKVLEMFKIAKKILTSYLPDIDFIYSIEGCDYVEIEDLKDLYDEGLRSILLVWNNENKYGSGNRTDKGLTKEGIDFIKEAIRLGIGIDLSHANDNTFSGMIEVLKENKTLCYASHSNSRSINDMKRNLSDEELKEIKNLNGLVGIVLCNYFFKNKEDKLEYITHLKHIIDIVGIDNVMLSTDNMEYTETITNYRNTRIYDYSNITESVKNDLKKYFNDEDIEKIMYKNAYDKIINKLSVK